MLGLFSFMSMEEQNGLWYFTGGQEITWSPQPDVYVFRTLAHGQYAGTIDTTVVANTLFRSDNPDKINIFFFRSGASAAAIAAVEQSVKNDPSFETDFPAITMVPNADYSQNLWYFADDLVLITFKTDSIALANADRIAQKYNMQQFDSPAGIAGGSYTYIFRFQPNNTYPDGLVLSRTIYINEGPLLSGSEPNLVKVYSQPSTTTTGIQATADEKEQFYVVNDGENTLRVYYRLYSANNNNTLRVYDMFGRQLYAKSTQSTANQVLVDISSFSAGLYFASMEDATGKPLYTRKFRKL